MAAVALILHVRLADPERDASRIAAIYRPAVESSSASFELVAPDPEEMARRIRGIVPRTPWLVAESEEHGVIGYAYAGPHGERAAYRWSVNLSAYVDPAWHGQGVGRYLYDQLLSLLRRQGFVSAYAGITLPNSASVALHEAIGMRPVGVFEHVGYKFGAWHDVAWYAMRLAELPDLPAEPVPLGELDRLAFQTHSG